MTATTTDRPRHHLGLEGAVTVPTTQLQLTQSALEDVLELSAIGAIHGRAGLGKTFSVAAFTSRLDPIDLIRVMFTPNATPLTVSRKIYKAIYGSRPDRGVSQYFLAEILEEDLSTHQRLVVVDEAQNLNTACFEYLRILNDQPSTRFGLVFVGGDGCWRKLNTEPMLRSRICRSVKFERIAPPDLYVVMRQFHPCLSHLTDDQLLLIDDTVGHGIFRNWATFTVMALRVARRHNHDIDDDVIANTFTMMEGLVDAR